jgi:hypothetical protein
MSKEQRILSVNGSEPTELQNADSTAAAVPMFVYAHLLLTTLVVAVANAPKIVYLLC